MKLFLQYSPSIQRFSPQYFLLLLDVPSLIASIIHPASPEPIVDPPPACVWTLKEKQHSGDLPYQFLFAENNQLTPCTAFSSHSLALLNNHCKRLIPAQILFPWYVIDYRGAKFAKALCIINNSHIYK